MLGVLFGSGFRLYNSPNIKLTIWLVGTCLFFCFLAHRGQTGGLVLLQCFSGVADAQNISGVSTGFNSRVPILASSVFSLILIIARGNTLES